jgi:hypothetical protein
LGRLTDGLFGHWRGGFEGRHYGREPPREGAPLQHLAKQVPYQPHHGSPSNRRWPRMPARGSTKERPGRLFLGFPRSRKHGRRIRE